MDVLKHDGWGMDPFIYLFLLTIDSFILRWKSGAMVFGLKGCIPGRVHYTHFDGEEDKL